MDSKDVNYDFAKAWDLSQGDFATNIANRILILNEEKDHKFTSVYDVCCGASNLLQVFDHCGFKCYGTETRQGMFDYSKEKLPNVTYYLTENMNDMPGKEKVDIVTCTHDLVNYFEEFSDWEKLFKNVAKKLTKNGIFVFDFYSKFKLSNWNESTYKSTPHLDCLTNIKSGVYDRTVITYTYYINYQNYYVKTKDIAIEAYFDTDRIVEALKKAGLKNVQFVDGNLNPTDPNEYAERIYIIASRK
ncbi:MAG: methyltransferase domain-containing protein [Clostridia bacterium]|nr:methyltransferase domain-containing protein [Clostridia bacterium]